MITQEHEYYLRFILLLLQGGAEVLREIAAKALQKCNTTLHQLLSANKPVIQKTRDLSKKQKEVLYPVSPSVAVVSNFKDYDITILSYLITNFLTRNLDSNESNAVDKIREMRNIYHAHATEAKMTFTTYTKEWNKLMRIIFTVSHNLPEVKRKKLTEIADSIENEVLDIKVVIDEIKKLDQTNDFFQYIQTSLEELNQNLDARYGNIQKALSDINSKLDLGKNSKVVNTVRGRLLLAADEQETVDYAEHVLLKASKDSIENCPTETNQQVREIVDKFIEDIEKLDIKVEKVSEGSILFDFKCSSLSALLDLIDYFNGSKFQARLQNIAEALENITGKKINVSGSLDVQSFQDVITKLQEKKYEKEVHFEMACTGVDGLLHALDIFEGGQAANYLNELSAALSKSVGKPVTLSTSIDVKQMQRAIASVREELVHTDADIFTADDLKHSDVSVGFFPFKRKLDEDRYWKKSLFLDDVKYANKALRKHLLPDQQMLNDLAKHFGRKSKLISRICKRVCVHITEKDESIYDVWPAVKINCNDIVFVIMVKANHSNNKSQKSRLKEIRYSYVKRSLGEVSYEGQYVINSRQFNKYSAELSSSEKKLLQRGINNNNVQLMKRHKYLMMISGSPVRSKGHDLECHTIERETCIALYVLVKGYIPINEEPFDTEYGGLSVDVREGFFQLFTGPVNRFDNIKHGCQIVTHQFGTVGGFVDYFGYGTCGLTCAHVVLDPTGMKSLASKEKDDMALGISLTDQIVYQPDKSLESNVIGNVVKAIYREGGNGESGIDLAVFHILQRYPMFGDFPDLKDGSPANVSYDSGKVADILRLGSRKVFKYGAATYLTSGEVVLDSSTLSVRTYETFEVNSDYNIKLHNLLEIRPDASFQEFAKKGDSGALVYCVGENNEPVCVGVVEGGTWNNSCVVMPILPILEQLNLTSLKSFQNSITERKMLQMGQSLAEQFTQNLRSACSSLETRISKTDARITSSECAMEIKLNQIEQNIRSVIEQERAKTVAEIDKLLQGFMLQTQQHSQLKT